MAKQLINLYLIESQLLTERAATVKLDGEMAGLREQLDQAAKVNHALAIKKAELEVVN